MTESQRPLRLIDHRVVRELMERTLGALGCDEDVARDVATVFLEADLRGMSTQGLDHMQELIQHLRDGRVDPSGRPRVVKDGPAYALVDGGSAPGPLVSLFATDLVTKKAREMGCALVGAVNCSDNFMIGYYADLIARAGLVGIAATDSDAFVHPFGGNERMLGTNPLAIAIPSDGDAPVCLDIATSIQSISHMRQAAYYGETVPEGTGVDARGETSRDGDAIYKGGALAPFGGHKGYGLGLCVALLSGPLFGASVMVMAGEAARWREKGHFFLAMDPAAFGDLDDFRAKVGAYGREIKGSRKAPGVEEIRIPGERGAAERARSLGEGIRMYDEVWARAVAVAEELGVEVPT